MRAEFLPQVHKGPKTCNPGKFARSIEYEPGIVVAQLNLKVPDPAVLEAQDN